MFVEECMTADPVVVTEAEPVCNAAELMQRRHIHQVPVVDGSDRLVGMLTDRDVRSAMGYDTKNRLELRVEEVMSANVVCANPAMDLREAVDLLRQHGFRALPVVKGEQIVGILSTTDVLSEFRSKLDEPSPSNSFANLGPW